MTSQISAADAVVQLLADPIVLAPGQAPKMSVVFEAGSSPTGYFLAIRLDGGDRVFEVAIANLSRDVVLVVNEDCASLQVPDVATEILIDRELGVAPD